MKLLLTLSTVVTSCLLSLILIVTPGCEKKECSTKTANTVQQVSNVIPAPLELTNTEQEEHKVIEINGKEEFNKFLAETPIAIIDFTATWCPPCRKLAPELEEIAVDYESQGVKVAKVDVDQNKDISSEYGVTGIPDVRIAVNGKIIDQVIGYNPPELISKLAFAIAKGDKAEVETEIETEASDEVQADVKAETNDEVKTEINDEIVFDEDE